MENDTALPREGLLEPVLPGSVTFDSSVLAPLQNNYLYEESKECFTYSSAYLINNATLQGRYSGFRTEKLENGYSEEELEESFGFLLFDDEARANTLADTGLMVGQGTCTTLGDSSTGVYISKYSDCLDLKRWYDGKTGFIVLLKLTKGRVKEVTENYTLNFTPPTFGFDCHVSDQLGAVCATTSSFLAFERTQYYMYELLDGGSKPEACPRHVCPFAIVAFSYGKTTISLELKEKSQEKKSFHYQPWSGQLEIESIVYDVGLQSIHGAMFPANLPKTVKVGHVIGVSELRKTLPQTIFETSFLGEVSLDSRCFSLYDVVSSEDKTDLSVLTEELKEKDLALVIFLDDGGFLIILHSSHFLSYEGVGTDKTSALQGMFIFPDSRTVPRETKRGHTKPEVSSEVLRVLPALNYAESEMEKCPPNPQGEALGTVEKHLLNFATLILPGLSSSPAREASMFPDQYDVPDGFPLVAPKLTEEAGARLNNYLNNPCSFLIPVTRAVELLTPEKQQRSDDDHDDDVYYYISSPEEAPQTPAEMDLERDVAEDADMSGGKNEEVKTTVKEQTEEHADVSADVPHSALSEKVGTPGTVVVSSDNLFDRTDPSPKLGDLPECGDKMVVDSEETSESVAVNEACSGGKEESSKDTPTETTIVPLPQKGSIVSEVAAVSVNLEAKAKIDTSGDLPVVDKDIPKEVGLPTAPISSENQTEALVEPQTNSDTPQTKRTLKRLPRRRGKRRKKGVNYNHKKVDQTSSEQNQNSTTPPCLSEESTLDQSGNSEPIDSSPSDPLNKSWRSLPRRKKLWNADVSLKRVLRSEAKSNEAEPLVKKSPSSTEPSVTEKIATSTPKRKMEGSSMKERYGLKTIITDCGWVFVPHGSEVATGDIKSSKDVPDSSSVTTTSPTKEKPKETPVTPSPNQLEKVDQHMPLAHIQNIPMDTSAKAPASEQITEKDTAPQKNPDQSSDHEPKKGSTKESVYKAISISKLKTVLKRAKLTKSPGSKDHEKPATDKAEPELKKSKVITGVDSAADSGKLSPLKDVKDKTRNVLNSSPQLTGSQEPSKTAQAKQTLVSWRELKKTPQEKPKAKENGCINVDPSAPKAIDKQAGPQPKSALTWDRVGRKSVSSEVKSSTSQPLHSDALNLLADLALSVNSDKILPNPAKPRQESSVGLKTCKLPESVLHALLRGSCPRLKLPPKSPFPEGLVVPGDLLLEISKEHSYSQPTSLLAGLSGAFPQIPPPAGRVESLLSLNPKLQLKLPDHSSGTVRQEKGSKNGWRHLTSLDVPLPPPKARRPRFLHHRHITEKEGLLQVARLWTEKYDFRYDSRFTNDVLEKSVTRALHGDWDFSIEDTVEQVHLIFHMWIGLFYSKHTSRFFHFDHSCPSLERKNPPNVSDNVSPIQATPKQPDDDSSSKEERTTSLRPASDILDLSVKASGITSHSVVTQGNSKENLAASSDIKSKLENTTGSKKAKNTTSSYQSPNVPTKLSVMDYRPTVNPTEESLTLDDDDSDVETDTTPESSYTKLLENNSAYSHLCEQASNMHIDEWESLKEQKNVLACKEQNMPEALKKIQSPGKLAPGTNFDPKALAVFHQVIKPGRPVILSKTYDQAAGRRIILGSLSFKDKAGDGAPASQLSESVSKGEVEVALGGKNNANVIEQCGHEKIETTCQTLEKSDSGHGGAKVDVTSAHEGRDHTPVDPHKVSNSPQENERALPHKREDTPISGGQNKGLAQNVIDDILVYVSEKEKGIIKPRRVDRHAQDGRNDETEGTHNIKDSEKDEPVSDVKDQTPPAAVGANVSADDKEKDVCDGNDNEKDGVEPVNEVNDGIAVDVPDVNDKPENGAGVSATDVSVQDVGGKMEEIRPTLEVKDGTSLDDEHHNDEMESVLLEGICENVTKERALEENEKSDSEKIKESNEGDQLVRDDTPSEHESLVSDWDKDCTGSVDMDISDGKDSEDEHQGEVPAEQTDSQTVELHEGERGTEKSVISSDQEHNSHCVQPEITSDSSTDHVSLSGGQVIEQKEGNSVAAPDDACIAKEDNSEGTKLAHSPDIRNETPEINQTEAKTVYSHVSPCTTLTSPESDEINESSHLDSTKAADDFAISIASVAPTEEVDSCKDLESQEKSTDHRPRTPTVCEISSDRISKLQHNSESGDVSPPALQIDTESEPNSRSCTPTQDEPPYSPEVCEDLTTRSVPSALDNQNFERPPHSVKRSPTFTKLETDGSAGPPTSSGTHIPTSPGHRAQSQSTSTISEGDSWSTKPDTEVKVSDYSKASFASEHGPKNISPARGVHSKDSQPQRDQYDHWSEEYDEQASEMHSSWMPGPSFSTGEPYNLRKPYACDEDPEGPITHFRNRASVHREFAQMPREATESDLDIHGWEQDFHYAASASAVDESNRVYPSRHQDSSAFSKPIDDSDSMYYRRKKSSKTCREKWDENFDGATKYSIRKTFSCGVARTKTLRTVTPYHPKGESKPSFDWRRYFRREEIFDTKVEDHRFVRDPPSSIVTVLDKKGNRVIFENASSSKQSVGAHGASLTATKDSFHDWEDGSRSKPDNTQSLMELEYLIFTEHMNRMLKNSKAASRAKSQHRSNVKPAENPMTIQFSRLSEQATPTQFDDTWPSLTKFKINVDMSERKGLREAANYGKPLHLQSLFCERGNEASCSRISDISKECAKSYNTMMNDVCTGKIQPRHSDKMKRKWDADSVPGSKPPAFCGRIKKAMFDNLHDSLNSIVRQACKIKYNFYILVTSADPFFEETKDMLEAEGHTAVEPYQFDIDDSGQTPLLIILRNEDVAEHICDVPYLLDLKKSSRVLFAGIDQPDDVVNLTHQELFVKGGFVVFDEIALDTLSLEHMKKVVGIMEELDKKGKWKWFLHYRDSRKLRENARCSPEAQMRKHFIDCCQEAGMVEVLPYHECDVISRDRPDYLRCLVRLQIQNASARFPVFITETQAESFGENGILTMNIFTFSRILSNDTCSVS